jgi:DNA-binding NarL/FixJ family response regulator
MRVVVADDALVTREGIARLLSEAGVEVAGVAGDADELLRKVLSTHPDVALVDIRMPPTNTDEGLRAAQSIRERHPGTAVLVLSSYLESEFATRLLEERPAGAGYLLKDRLRPRREVEGGCPWSDRGAAGGRRARARRPSRRD